MAQTLARSRTTRHLSLSNLLTNRLLSTTPSPPLHNRPSLTPLSHTLRSLSSFLSPKQPPPPPLSSTVRSIHASSTVRSIDSPSFRPLSPHLPVYQPQVSSTLSILNRISGVILTVVVLGFYLIYIKSAPICFTFNNFYQFLFYSSKLSLITLEISALALAYHILIGIRHLSDDLGGIKKQKAAAALFLFLALGFALAYSPELLNSGSNFTQVEAELFVKDSSKTT